LQVLIFVVNGIFFLMPIPFSLSSIAFNFITSVKLIGLPPILPFFLALYKPGMTLPVINSRSY
jgi:hypothetical protein